MSFSALRHPMKIILKIIFKNAWDHLQGSLGWLPPTFRVMELRGGQGLCWNRQRKTQFLKVDVRIWENLVLPRYAELSLKFLAHLFKKKMRGEELLSLARAELIGLSLPRGGAHEDHFWHGVCWFKRAKSGNWYASNRQQLRINLQTLRGFGADAWTKQKGWSIPKRLKKAPGHRKGRVQTKPNPVCKPAGGSPGSSGLLDTKLGD